MKKLDLLSIIGILIALGAVATGNYLDGGRSGTLLEVTALIIVIGGTLGATLVQTPMGVFIRSLKILKWVFFTPEIESKEFISRILNWSRLARREGLLGLEVMAQKEQDPFTKKALQLLVDGSEPSMIKSIMEIDLIAKEQRDLEAARVFEGMGGYSPTIGILGAVLGLIHVMNNLEDPAMLGTGVATAFVATIYGVGFANLFFLPVANKLKNIVISQIQLQELMLEGIIAIAEGENPRYIENKLRGYFSHQSS